jgi:lysophospholipase L1-like esterase
MVIQLSCKQVTENDPVSDPELPYPPLPAITLQWTEQNSIVCFGTSLTYGYGAGEKKPFCKTEEPTIPVLGRSALQPSYSKRANYIHFTTDQILNLTKAHEQRLALFYKATGVCSACVGDSSYPRFLQEYLQVKVYNQGYTAARTETGLDVLQDSVLSKNPVLVLLEFGANDFLQKVDVHRADSLLSLLIQRIINAGPKIVLISFIHPDVANYIDRQYWTTEDSILGIAYWNMINDVAKRYSLPLIDNPFKGIGGHPELMSDIVHPNGEGYKKMAENIYYALIETFKNNDMLK